MRILWTIICQRIEQPRRKGQISRNIQPAKKKKSIFLTTVKKKETITRSEIKSVKTKQSKKPVPWRQKSRTEWLHQEILSNRQRRTYTYFQTIKKKQKTKNWKGGNTSKFIQWDHQHFDTKTRWSNYRKRILQVFSSGRFFTIWASREAHISTK